MIAIHTENLEIIWVVFPNDVCNQLLAASFAVLPSLIPIVVDVVYAQKFWLCFSAAGTERPIMIQDHLITLSIISALAGGEFV